MTATRFPAVFSVALCLTLGSWAAAEDADKRAAKIVRQAHELKESGSFDAALELARSAVREFEVALRASPNDASCRFALAQLHHQLGESGAATEHLERALALDPNNVKMISFKGVRLFLAKKVAEGEQEFLRAIELEPKNACVRMAYATALGAIGRHEQAEVRAREAVELDPRDPDAVLFLASLVFNAKKYVEWEKTVRSGIEHRPHDTRLRGHLIDVLYVFNRFDDAYAECQKSAEVDPYDPENEMRMLNLCKFLTTPAEPKPHLDRIYQLHRVGKYKPDCFMREEFFVRDPRDRSMRVQVEEHFELKDRIAFKYRFFVYDEKRQEDCTIILGTYEEANELLRKKGKLAETEKHYSLNALRDDDVQFFGEFRTLPSYEQTRELAIEIIQGNRLPRAPAESAKQAEEAK